MAAIWFFVMGGIRMESECDSHQVEDGQGKAGESVIADVPIVRSSTPKALSFNHLLAGQGQEQERDGRQVKGSRRNKQGKQAEQRNTAFPTKAPVAPPLPEECEEVEDDAINMVEATPLPLPGGQQSFDENAPEFIWLFEYGLEMDSAVLNAPEKLDGTALLYGPAILKGYRVVLDAIETPEGKPLVTVTPDADCGAAVWGVLYRVPARLASHRDDDASLLDKVHFAAPPAPLFEAVTVVVHESYRGREVVCTTYTATTAALQQFRQRREKVQHGKSSDALFARRFLEIARKSALPDEYVQELTSRTANLAGEQPAIEAKEDVPVEHTAAKQAQDTEPLLVLAGKEKASVVEKTESGIGADMRSRAWMMAFAVYLVALLLLVLTLAVLQGMGFASRVFTASFTPLGIPWFILVYGLLGGCVSSIVTLGRRGLATPPSFVLITWFTRPFIGSLLAMLAYLLMNTGLLALGGSGQQHVAFFSLLAAVAGLSEGWIFCRKE
jgi:hypothetical protein